MDLLVTLIGNAAVHPGFRTLFLENPDRMAEAYGFRLTKGDHEILTTVFANLEGDDLNRLVAAFEALEIEIYKRLQPENLSLVPSDSAAVLPPKKCMKPCSLSIWPPPEICEELKARGLQPAA